jgi:hypothetical protein
MSVIAEILRDTKEELLRDMCLIETSYGYVWKFKE